jgi:hypothetical protein
LQRFSRLYGLRRFVYCLLRPFTGTAGLRLNTGRSTAEANATERASATSPENFIDLKDEGGPIVAPVGGLYMNKYVRLSANGRRLYLADTALSPAKTQTWDMKAVARLQAKACGVARSTNEQPAGGDFYLGPDGYSLFCRTGAVYWVTEGPPPPRVEKGK